MTGHIHAALMRSLVTWRKSEPKAMAEQSQAALVFAFADAKHDIALLAAQRDELLSAAVAVLEMCERHGDFRNGVTDPTGSIDEGNVLASQYFEVLRAAITKAKATGEPK